MISWITSGRGSRASARRSGRRSPIGSGEPAPSPGSSVVSRGSASTQLRTEWILQLPPTSMRVSDSTSSRPDGSSMAKVAESRGWLPTRTCSSHRLPRLGPARASISRRPSSRLRLSSQLPGSRRSHHACGPFARYARASSAAARSAGDTRRSPAVETSTPREDEAPDPPSSLARASDLPQFFGADTVEALSAARFFARRASSAASTRSSHRS